MLYIDVQTFSDTQLNNNLQYKLQQNVEMKAIPLNYQITYDTLVCL